MASTKLISFTDLRGNPKKISAITVFKISDVTSKRIIKTFKPTNQFEASDSLNTLKVEAGSLFSATENGVNILLTAISIVRVVSNGSGCDIFYQGGDRVSVSESSTVIEDRIDSLGAKKPSDPTPPTTLSEDNYYNLTNTGTFTIVDAVDVYNSSNVFQMTIYNNSGNTSTFNREGTAVFNFLGDQLTTFDLLDGEEITLTAVSTTEYNIG